MSEYPDYLIPVTDCRFPITWHNWSAQILMSLEVGSDMHNTNYLSTFDFNVLTPNTSIEQELPKRIYRELHKMRSSPLDISWIGYDTTYAPSAKIAAVLDMHMKKRRKDDYQLFGTSAYALTTSLNTELLDYPIPKINIVCISF